MSKQYTIVRLTTSFVRRCGCKDSPDTLEMAKELDIKGRRCWVLSEPEGGGWKARVVEVREDGSSEQLGIEPSERMRELVRPLDIPETIR